MGGQQTETARQTHRQRLVITPHSQSKALQCILCSGLPLSLSPSLSLSVAIAQPVRCSLVSPCRCAWLSLGWCMTEICVCVGAAGELPFSTSHYLWFYDSLLLLGQSRLSCRHFLSSLSLFLCIRLSFPTSQCSLMSRPRSTPLFLFPPGSMCASAVSDGVTSLQDFLYCTTLPCLSLRHLKLLCSHSPSIINATRSIFVKPFFHQIYFSTVFCPYFPFLYLSSLFPSLPPFSLSSFSIPSSPSFSSLSPP